MVDDDVPCSAACTADLDPWRNWVTHYQGWFI